MTPPTCHAPTRAQPRIFARFQSTHGSAGTQSTALVRHRFWSRMECQSEVSLLQHKIRIVRHDINACHTVSYNRAVGLSFAICRGCERKTAAPVSECRIPPLDAYMARNTRKPVSDIDKWTRKISTTPQGEPWPSERCGDGVQRLGDQGGQSISNAESNSLTPRDNQLVAKQWTFDQAVPCGGTYIINLPKETQVIDPGRGKNHRFSSRRGQGWHVACRGERERAHSFGGYLQKHVSHVYR